MTEPSQQSGPEAQGAGAPADIQPPSQDDKTMAVLAHLLGLPLSVLGPLIIWLIKKDESPFVDDQGKEALNFQITVLIIYVALTVGSTVLACLTLGFGAFLVVPFMGAAVVLDMIFCILAAIEASKGQRYRYPLTFRLIA